MKTVDEAARESVARIGTWFPGSDLPETFRAVLLAEIRLALCRYASEMTQIQSAQIGEAYFNMAGLAGRAETVCAKVQTEVDRVRAIVIAAQRPPAADA